MIRECILNLEQDDFLAGGRQNKEAGGRWR